MAKTKNIKKVAYKKKVEEFEVMDTSLCDRCNQPLGAGFITVASGKRYCSPACQGTDR